MQPQVPNTMPPSAPPTGGSAPDAEDMQDGGADEGTEDDDTGSNSIELEIKADGTLVVSLEPGDDESKETQETPAKNIDDACRIIKEIYKQLMGATPTAQDQSTEDQAFQQEMGK